MVVKIRMVQQQVESFLVSGYRRINVTTKTTIMESIPTLSSTFYIKKVPPILSKKQILIDSLKQL